MHDLLTAWAEFEPGDNANVLCGDEVLIEQKDHVSLHSWDTFVGQKTFGKSDGKLHLSLLPQPFFGSLAEARIVILTLNPGLHPIDYFAQLIIRDPQYMKASLDTLKQRFAGEYPFMWLNPQLSWHSGFTYWHGRFAAVIDSFVRETCISRAEAMSFVAKSVAVLELVPYHSVSFGLPAKVMNKLRSVRLALDFVSDMLVPRADAGDTVLVVARKGAMWGLCEAKNILIYKGTETRGAYLTPTTRGGKAILAQLKSQWAGAQGRTISVGAASAIMPPSPGVP